MSSFATLELRRFLQTMAMPLASVSTPILYPIQRTESNIQQRSQTMSGLTTVMSPPTETTTRTTTMD